MGKGKGDILKYAEHLDGPTVTRFKEMAKKHKMWLSLGGFHEKTTTEGKVYNSHLIINDEGDIKAIYRKIHLFKVDLPNGPVLDESLTTKEGNEIVVCDSPVGRLGLSTCYDLRFPELYNSLRFRDAEVLLVPSAFTIPTGKAHWEILLRARAIETQCYVVAPAQCGEHNDKRSSYGHSMIIDPWGEVLVDLEETCPGIGSITTNLKYVNNIRTNMPILTHKRINDKLK